MSLILFDLPASPNAVKVRLALHHLGLTFEHRMVDLTQGGHLQPDYVALNPNAMIPTLQDGDFVLWESNAILLYLAEKHQSDLIPGDLRERADMHRWLSWQLCHWSPAVGAFTFQNLAPHFFPGFQQDAAVIEKSLKDYHRFAQVLDSHLQGRHFVVGQKLSLADLSLAASLVHARMIGLPLAQYPQVEAWFTRMEALPIWKQAAPAMQIPA